MSTTQSGETKQNYHEETKSNLGGEEKKVSCNDSMDFGRYIQNFQHQTFTPESCAAELVGNSIDAKSKKIKVIVQNKGENPEIRYTDNGLGMCRKGVLRYCKFHGENHKTDSSIGTQGVGGKKSAYLLSRKTGLCKIVTTNNSSDYTTLIMDFKNAIATKDLGNLFRHRSSSSDEIKKFVQDRGGDKNSTGFTLITDYDFDTYQMYHNLITKPRDIEETDHRLDIAFGESNIEFSFVNMETPTQNGSLKEGYNYFDGEMGPLDFEIVDDSDSGIVRCSIDVYQNKRNKNERAYPFEYMGKQMSVPIKARGGRGNTPVVDRNNYDKDVEWNKLTREGQLIVEIAFRKNDDFFNHDSVCGPDSASQCQSNYDKKFFKKPNQDFQASIKINRNCHALAPIGQPKVLNCSRATMEGRALLLTQITLRARTTGSQDDKFVDELIGMSQNKAAMREHNCLPHQLMRSIIWLRSEHRNKVLVKMTEIATSNNKIKIQEMLAQQAVLAQQAAEVAAAAAAAAAKEEEKEDEEDEEDEDDEEDDEDDDEEDEELEDE